uniref:Uncharacterized protein n=1 Tax=Tanacetum cinerariifolium TaxID=118510 RepID=A0A699HKU0_TANCI|nr:hypothetical protein [Tanacetum cinerariifolium]
MQSRIGNQLQVVELYLFLSFIEQPRQKGEIKEVETQQDPVCQFSENVIVETFPLKHKEVLDVKYENTSPPKHKAEADAEDKAEVETEGKVEVKDGTEAKVGVGAYIIS